MHASFTSAGSLPLCSPGQLLRGDRGRYWTVISRKAGLFDPANRILDIGARNAMVRNEIRNPQRFVAVDLSAGEGIDVAANLERGLPFPDQSFDTVVCLDVLEHTDQLLLAFRDVLRVAKSWVVIALPNVYEVSSRLRFFAGRPLSGKYRLEDGPAGGGDRHRWIFTPAEASWFIERHASICGFEVDDWFYMTLGYSSLPMRKIMRMAERAQLMKTLLGGTLVYYLRRASPAADDEIARAV